MEVTSPPQHILRLAKAGDAHLACAAVSPNASHIAYSDGARLRVYELAEPSVADGGGSAAADTPPTLRRLRLPADLPPARLLAFGAAPAAAGLGPAPLLATVGPDGDIRVVDLSMRGTRRGGVGSDGEDGDEAAAEPEASVSVRFSEPRDAAAAADGGGAAGPSAAAQLTPPVSQLCFSPDGAWLAAVGPRQIHIFGMNPPRYHGRLPLLQVSRNSETWRGFSG